MLLLVVVILNVLVVAILICVRWLAMSTDVAQATLSEKLSEKLNVIEIPIVKLIFLESKNT